jgi:hypothetical protein
VSDLHLDDEQLSALLDGEPGDRAHVADCPACAARLSALTSARDAVAAAVVPPLSAAVLEGLIAAAVDAAPAGDPAIVPLTRRRRLRTPPPAWLVGAAAALLALVGVAGVLRSVSGSDGGSMALTSGARDDADESVAANKALPAGEAGAGAAASGAAVAAQDSSAPAFADPEVVAFDLADQQDPAELAVLLRDVGTASRLSATEAAATAGGGDDVGSSRAPTTSAAPVPPAAPSASGAADRAQCRSAAEAAAGDGLGDLLATGRVQWRGQAAEVLVFLLRSPEEGVTRRAMVLQRPGCALLADRRF